MENMTYVDENGTVLFSHTAYPEDEGVTITTLVEDEQFEFLESISERLANREQMCDFYKNQLDKAKKALARFINDYYHDENEIYLDYESCEIFADEILNGKYEPKPCDECTGSDCKECNHRKKCITW